MAGKIAKHEIISVESDRDRVRLRPTIYTTSVDDKGAIHIIFEIVDNALDEISANDSVGDSVTLMYDTKTKVVSVTDNGGGIPHDGMLRAISILSSSGKYGNSENSHFGQSSGINGYGLKLLTFLSEWSEFTSCQKGKLLTYRFEDGLLKDTKTGTTKTHGTIISGKISQRFIDINGVDAKDIRERFEEKSYLYPSVKMNLIITEGDKRKKDYDYIGRDIADRVEEWKPDTPIIRVADTRKVKILADITDTELTERKVVIDVAFAMKEDVLDADDKNDFIISYGNNVKTYAGGTHVDGVKDGIVKYFKNQVIPNLKGRDKDLQITPSDICSGMCGFITAKVYEPLFRGQFKDKLENQEVKFAVRDSVYETLCSAKSNVVNPMIEFVKRVARGRLASKKSRKKDVGGAFSKDRIDKFNDIVYNLSTVDPELILVEGDSASNCASSARDPYNQAIFSVRKPANIFDEDPEHVRSTVSVFNDVVDILGIEPGKKCDPEKSTMRRVLMLTDGDIDGDSIAISVICLMAKHCKPMVDAGMVGRILPPAYSIPTGKKPPNDRVFVHTQREFFNVIMRRFIKEVKVTYKGKEFSKAELYEFLSKNFVYDLKLDKLADRYCCNPKLMEYIAWKYHGNYTDQKKSYWLNTLKQYQELTVLLEQKIVIIDGDVPGSGYMNLAFDDYFDRFVHRFKELQSRNDTIDGFEINGESGKTLYDVMKAMRKYIPAGVQRYKGLGELMPDELRELCMDKDKRTVIIMKFKDFEKDMEKINIIMSTKKEYMRARSKLLMSMRADDLDIDT